MSYAQIGETPDALPITSGVRPPDDVAEPSEQRVNRLVPFVKVTDGSDIASERFGVEELDVVWVDTHLLRVGPFSESLAGRLCCGGILVDND